MSEQEPEELNVVVDEIRRLIRIDPFRPFSIVMASGDRYEITDGLSVAVGKTVTVIVPPRATTVTLKNVMITAVEVAEPV